MGLQEQRDAEERRTLMALAKQLRDRALSADRPDVVAKVDEVILLLAGTEAPTGKRDGSADKTNAVLRILDGFGL